MAVENGTSAVVRPVRTGTRTSVLAAAVHVPGRSAADLPGSPDEPACAPGLARTVLGRKGLLGKEPATLMALCAVHRALGLPPGRPAEPVPHAAGTAVVVASNLGNVNTVCSVVRDVRARSVAAISPLDIPNVSSNVIASTIAIWYGFTGPNLMVCSGATAGLDAVRLAQLLLRAGRAERVVVVGVEPVDPVSTALAGDWLREGAACVVLGGPGTGGTWCGPVRRHAEPVPIPGELSGSYGALGVLGVAVAASSAAAGSTMVGCGDPDDGWASVEVGRA